MTYLLDINVLLAYAYSEHIFHSRVAHWITSLESKREHSKFATCAIVDLGFIRIAGRESGPAENEAAHTPQ